MRRKWNLLKTQWVNGVLNFFFPPQCLKCFDPVEFPFSLCARCWHKIDFISAPLCQCCGRPFDFEKSGGMLCAQCFQSSPVFTTARSVFIYNDESKDLILRFKHGDALNFARFFSPLMAATAKNRGSLYDSVLAVPLHWRRLLTRQYNQAAVLARGVAQELNLPFYSNVLLRHRYTPFQGYKSRQDRKKNVRRAFCINPKLQNKIRGQRVLLIDDVLTSGATVSECALVLRKAGVQEVHVLTLARP